MFQLTIETDNAAFHPEPGWEVARLLAEAAQHIKDGSWHGPLFDVNGNRVGTYDLDFVPNEDDIDDEEEEDD